MSIVNDDLKNKHYESRSDFSVFVGNVIEFF